MLTSASLAPEFLITLGTLNSSCRNRLFGRLHPVAGLDGDHAPHRPSLSASPGPRVSIGANGRKSGTGISEHSRIDKIQKALNVSRIVRCDLHWRRSLLRCRKCDDTVGIRQAIRPRVNWVQVSWCWVWKTDCGYIRDLSQLMWSFYIPFMIHSPIAYPNSVKKIQKKFLMIMDSCIATRFNTRIRPTCSRNNASWLTTTTELMERTAMITFLPWLRWIPYFKWVLGSHGEWVYSSLLVIMLFGFEPSQK